MSVGFDPLYEFIIEERDPNADTRGWPAVRLGRHWLLTGESFTSKEFGERANCGTSNIKHVKDTLIGLGYRLVRTTEGKTGRNGYQARIGIANLDHVPTEAMVNEYLERRSMAKTTRDKQLRERRKRRERKRAAEVEHVDRQPYGVAVDANHNPIKVSHINGHLPDNSMLPALDEALTVYALARNDDGTLTVALRNGERRFLTTLTGAVE